MCVGNMEGYSGSGDCTSEDMASWLSPSKDELDIVREAFYVQMKIIWMHLRPLSHYAPFLNVRGFLGQLG